MTLSLPAIEIDPLAWASLAWRRFKGILEIARSDRSLRLLFVALLAVDLCWIVWFGVTEMFFGAVIDASWDELRHLRITDEGGYPELFNYATTAVLVLLLGRLALSTKQWIYVSLTIVFAVVLLDDSVAIHETAGAFFVQAFEIEPVLGLRAQDMGEVITWAVFGIFVVPLILVGLVRSSPIQFENGLALLIPFVALLFCAIFVDQLYSNFHALFPGSGTLLDILEDGGEMIAITTGCLCAATLVKYGASRFPDVEATPE
jgi:hypothetical protein